MDKYWTAISDYYQDNEPIINGLIFVCSLILAMRYFFYLKDKARLGSRIWAFFDVLTGWLPANDPVEDDKQARKDAEEVRQAFLKKRKARKPGNLTDEMQAGQLTPSGVESPFHPHRLTSIGKPPLSPRR